jgi:hypothetical protein
MLRMWAVELSCHDDNLGGSAAADPELIADGGRVAVGSRMGSSGSVATTGKPPSDFSDLMCNGSARPERHAVTLRLAPRCRAEYRSGRPFGAKKITIFSTMPSTGTLTRLNMAMPRRASIRAKSCGVETITAPLSGTCCAMVSWASPVPGGMSTTMMSSAPHSTSRSI